MPQPVTALEWTEAALIPRPVRTDRAEPTPTWTPGPTRPRTPEAMQTRGPRHISFQGDTLAITNFGVSAGSPGKVLIYQNAGTLAGGAVPTKVVSDPALTFNLKSKLLADDTLYCFTSGRILVFSKASTNPALVLTIDTDVTNAKDFDVVE